MAPSLSKQRLTRAALILWVIGVLVFSPRWFAVLFMGLGLFTFGATTALEREGSKPRAVALIMAGLVLVAASAVWGMRLMH